MKPRTPSEELIAQTLANALRGQLTLGPLDVMRLAGAAREVEPHRIAALAIERWLTIDPRARDLVCRFALHQQIKK
jgi:hypothetical protein